MRSAMRSAGGNGTLPSYAQPTISFSQHTANNQNNNTLILKAGASKSRPSSKSTLKANKMDSSLRNVRPQSTNGPKFLNHLFSQSKTPTAHSKVEKENLTSPFKTSNKVSSYSTPNSSPSHNKGEKYLSEDSNIGPSTNRSPSGSYRSPSLAQKALKLTENGIEASAQPLDKNLESVMKETENLIKKVGQTSKDVILYSYEQLRGIAKGREYVSTKEWNKLIDYHFHVYTQLQDKIKLDHSLIQNVLELNNFISNTIKDHERELDVAQKEISRLQTLLNAPNEMGSENKPTKGQQVDPMSLSSVSLCTTNTFASNEVERGNTTPTRDISAPPSMIEDSEGKTTRDDDGVLPLTLNGNNNPYVQFQQYITRSPISPFIGIAIPGNRARDAYDGVFQNITD